MKPFSDKHPEQGFTINLRPRGSLRDPLRWTALGILALLGLGAAFVWLDENSGGTRRYSILPDDVTVYPTPANLNEIRESEEAKKRAALAVARIESCLKERVCADQKAGELLERMNRLGYYPGLLQPLSSGSEVEIAGGETNAYRVPFIGNPEGIEEKYISQLNTAYHLSAGKVPVDFMVKVRNKQGEEVGISVHIDRSRFLSLIGSKPTEDRWLEVPISGQPDLSK